MASKRQPKNKFLNAKYLKEKVSKDELVQRLKNVNETLSEIDQEPTDHLDPISATLAAQNFIRHKDKEVKVLVASCLADIMRIYAPDAPFDDSQLQTIFTFFVAQLRGLEDPSGPLFSRYFYLLEHLAVVKAFVVITGFDTDDLAVDLFRTLFEVVSDGLSSKVVAHMVDVMITVLEESENISQEMLDVILENLAMPAKKDNPAAYRLAQSVIDKSSNRLEPYVAGFLNGIILEGQSGESELADQAYGLIYELNQINSTLLLHVLPNLVNELLVEDNAQRAEAVKLLGRMFASRGSKLGTNYSELFSEFLKRFSDKDHDIRLMMVAFGKHFLINQPDLAPQISDILLHRVQDPDERMRKAVVASIIDAAMTNPDAVEYRLLEAVGHRTRDRRLQLRSEASELLAKLYQAQSRERDSWTQEDEKKFSRIPNILMHVYYVADSTVSTKYRLTCILDEYLIPSNISVDCRGRALVDMFRSLDDKGARTIDNLLKQKRQFQKWMTEYLDARREVNLETKELGDESVSVAKPKLHSKVKLIATKLPEMGRGINAETALHQLAEMKDNRIFHYLSVLCSPSSNYSDIMKAKNEIYSRIGSKNPVYEYVKAITINLSTAFFSADSIPFIVESIEQAVEHDDDAYAVAGLNLIGYIASSFPSVILPVVSDICDVLKNENSVLVSAALSVIDSVSSITLDDGSSLATPIKERLANILPEFFNDGLPVQAKRAVNIIVKVFKDEKGQDILSEYLAETVDELKRMDFLRVSCALSAISRIALLLPNVFTNEANDIIKFVVKDLLSNKHDAEDKFDDELGWERDAKLAGIKVLVSYILPLEGDDRSLASPPVIRLLLRLVRDSGRLTKQKPVSPTVAEALHLAGAKGLLKLCTKSYYDRVIGPEEFLSLALVARSDSLNTRKVFLEKIQKYLQAYMLQLRFASILPLYCNESDASIVATAKLSLGQFGKTRRDLLGRAGPHAINSIAQATLMPEYSLPYFVFLLAHLPDFPSPLAESSISVLTKPIGFYYNEILKLGQNVPFIRQLLDTMKTTRDALARNSNNIHVVCELAMLILRRRMENRAYEDAGYPGEIRLPSSMFAVAVDGRSLATTTFLPVEVASAIQEKSHRSMDGAAVIKSPSVTPSRKRTSASPAQKPAKRAKKVTKKVKAKKAVIPKKRATKRRSAATKSRQRTIEQMLENNDQSSSQSDSGPSEATKTVLDTSKPLDLSSDSEDDRVPTRRVRRKVRA